MACGGQGLKKRHTDNQLKNRYDRIRKNTKVKAAIKILGGKLPGK